MDTSVGVSLDELTFELTGDEILQHEISNGGPCENVDNSDNQIYTNGEEIGVSDNKEFGYPDSFVTKEFVQTNLDESSKQLESRKNDCTPPVGKTVIHAPDFEDFDAEVPPLSLFPSSKDDGSDESDSEFEVPDRPITQKEPHVSDEDNKEVASNSTSTSNKAKHGETETNVGINLNPVNSSHSQPQILTPRNKVSADLSLLPQFTNVSTSCEDASKDTLRPEAVAVADISGLPTRISGSGEPGMEVQFGTEARDVYMSSHEPSLSSESSQVQQNTLQASSAVEFGKTESEATDSQKPSIVTTAEDWEGVQTVEPGFAHADERSAGSAALIESKPLVKFAESWAEFEVEDYTPVKGQIKTHIERRGFSALTHLLFGPPKLSKDLVPQKELLFCIAATQFDNEKESHIRVLQTIYRSLTGSKFDCQRYGGHWEEVGFQGRDPATDLRGTGMLALLHLLYFLRDPRTKELARDVYKLSLHPTQNFPFCIMGINLSRICLQVLREDLFNKECNKSKDVTGTMNSVYSALFLQLYQIWKKGKTIADSGFVLQEVETYCRKHSKNILKDLETYEKAKKQNGPFGEAPQTEPAFFSVCKEDNCDTKSPAELY